MPAQQTDDAERSESLCLCDQLRGTDSKLLVSRHLVGRIKLIKPGDKRIGEFGAYGKSRRVADDVVFALLHS